MLQSCCFSATTTHTILLFQVQNRHRNKNLHTHTHIFFNLDLKESAHVMLKSGRRVLRGAKRSYYSQVWVTRPTHTQQLLYENIIKCTVIKYQASLSKQTAQVFCNSVCQDSLLTNDLNRQSPRKHIQPVSSGSWLLYKVEKDGLAL